MGILMQFILQAIVGLAGVWFILYVVGLIAKELKDGDDDDGGDWPSAGASLVTP